MALYDTVANVVSDCAVELGLGAVSDVFASTDANVVQLRTLLKSAGRQLLLENEWLQATKEHTFTTNGSASYNLPTDFSRMVDGTEWNRTKLNAVRSVSPQEWQWLQARSGSGSLAILYRPTDSVIKVWPSTSTGETVAFEYVSRYWMKTSGAPAPDKDAPTANTDTICFDAMLATKLLKAAWLRNKGFDTSAAEGELEAALSAVRSANVAAAKALSLSRGADDDAFDVRFVTSGGVIY